MKLQCLVYIIAAFLWKQGKIKPDPVKFSVISREDVSWNEGDFNAWCGLKIELIEIAASSEMTAPHSCFIVSCEPHRTHINLPSCLSA